mgnify:CR=1 FL=1
MMNASGIIIPEGFKYVLGTENTGFTIEDFNGNQFVWIPGGDTIEDGACEGFFISRYEIAMDMDGKFVSKANKHPIIDISFFDAEKIASSMNSRIISNKQFERIIKWLIETKTMSEEEIFVDSSNRGNYKNSGPHRMVKTGFNKAWMINNIDNLAGNLWTWTCTGDNKSKILRGGCCMLDGHYSPLGRKCLSYLEGSRFYNGLRVVL